MQILSRQDAYRRRAGFACGPGEERSRVNLPARVAIKKRWQRRAGRSEHAENGQYPKSAGFCELSRCGTRNGPACVR